MKALVVYESHWGNTAAIARAIADGLGDGAVAVPADEATPERLRGLDLLVAGAPIHVFGLPSEKSIGGLKADNGWQAPDLSHPILRAWLDELPASPGTAAVAFETRMRWSPGGATGAIEQRLGQAGYRIAGKAARFVVTGTQGPLRPGEVERARAWGASLADHAA